MKSKQASSGSAGRVFIVVLDDGEEAFNALTEFARRNDITGASVTAIGAFSEATVGWFDFMRKDYEKIPVSEQCEVLSLMGDVAMDDEGRASIHLHAVVGLSDGSTRGGHFLSGKVHPTLEVTLTEMPAHLRRMRRPELGIALIDLGS